MMPAATTYGDPDQPAVLLLHGAGQTRGDWHEVAEALAEAGRHVIALDLHGDVDASVAELRATLEAMRARPVIVAASSGGWNAIATLGEGGEHLATGLVLVDAPPPSVSGAAAARRAMLEARPVDGGEGAVGEADDLPGEQADPVGLAPRLARAAAAIRVPTLVVRGGRSAASTRHDMRALSELIADAEFVEIADAGHLVAVDQTDAFNAVLLDFLERRIPRSAPEYRAGSDPRTLRDALGCFGTGVTVVTTRDAGGQPIGLTANSFTSVSLDPPLLLVCLAKSAGSLPAFEASGVLAVNVLHIGQQTVSGRFASRQADRFAGTPWETWDTGAPIISGSLASFDCEKFAMHDAGDHVIVIGRVLRVRFEPRRDPLLYFRGRYRRLHFS